jgi:hypothetical protein
VRAEKVNKGKTGAHQAELSVSLSALLDREWQQVHKCLPCHILA